MMNLISFETPPPLARQGISSAATFVVAKEASSSGTCVDGSHLDLSLGISLSPGGRCSATGCGHRSGGDVGHVQSSGVMASTAIANTLSSGNGGNLHGIVSSSSWMAAFMPSPTGFMHPWSLAARQQKAAAEQDRRLVPLPASDASVVSLPSPAVGWPPVHTSRRQLVTATHTPKLKADEPKDAAMATAGDDKEVVAVPMSCTITVEPPRVNMFAKVHMDGCLIGRKINLRAHRSYDSLSRALTKMTRNFFCHPVTTPEAYRTNERSKEKALMICKALRSPLTKKTYHGAPPPLLLFNLGSEGVPRQTGSRENSARKSLHLASSSSPSIWTPSPSPSMSSTRIRRTTSSGRGKRYSTALLSRAHLGGSRSVAALRGAPPPERISASTKRRSGRAILSPTPPVAKPHNPRLCTGEI